MSLLRLFIAAVLFSVAVVSSRGSVNVSNTTTCSIKTVSVHFEVYNNNVRISHSYFNITLNPGQSTSLTDAYDGYNYYYYTVVSISSSPDPSCTVPETWTSFATPYSWTYGSWTPDCNGYPIYQWFTQQRTNQRLHYMGEVSNLGNYRNTHWETETVTEYQNVQGCQASNWFTFYEPQTNWSEISSSPSAGSYWEDEDFTQNYTEARTVRVGNRDQWGYETNVTILTEERDRQRVVSGTRPLNWQTSTDYGSWHEVSSSPSASSYWEDEYFQQSYTEERTITTTESNDRGDANVSTNVQSWNGQRGAWGTRSLNWQHVTEYGSWVETSAVPATSSYPLGQAFNQSYTSERAVTTLERNDRGDTRNASTVTETQADTRTAYGTQVADWQPFTEYGPWVETSATPERSAYPLGVSFQQSYTEQRTITSGEQNGQGGTQNVTTSNEARSGTRTTTGTGGNTAPVATITGSETLNLGEEGFWEFAAQDQNSNLFRWRFYAETNDDPQWTYINGGFVADSFPTAFDASGTYKWIVDVEDGSGATHTASIIVHVGMANSPPSAYLDLDVDQDTDYDVPVLLSDAPLYVTAHAFDPDGDLGSMGYRWLGHDLRKWWDLTGAGGAAVREYTDIMDVGASNQYVRAEVWDASNAGTAGDWQAVVVLGTWLPNVAVTPVSPKISTAIDVIYSDALDSETWIGIYPTNESNNMDPIRSGTVPNAGNGIISFPLGTGFTVGATYEARLFPMGTFNPFAESNAFTVVANETTYSLTVQGGVVSGRTDEDGNPGNDLFLTTGWHSGDVVTIEAVPASGQTFVQWSMLGAGSGSIGYNLSASTTFTMASSDAGVQALYNAPPPNYTITVDGGHAIPSGPQPAGTSLEIIADPPSGMMFTSWSQVGAGTLIGPLDATAAFIVGEGPATLTASFVDHAPPVISAQPLSRNSLPGLTATFSVTVSGENLSYQWLKDGSPLANDGHFSGVTTPTLVIEDVQLPDHATYSAAVSNLYGSVISRPAALSVGGIPYIREQPESAVANAGHAVQFTVGASSNLAMAFKWQRQPVSGGDFADLSEGGDYTGVLTPTLRVASLAAGMNGDKFRCVVSNVNGSTASEGGILSVGEVDSDGDGMPDWWERDWFYDQDALPDADPDGDGVSNLDEYHLWRSPKQHDYIGSYADVTITVLAKGSASQSTPATLTLTREGTPYKFKFTSLQSATWSEAVADVDMAYITRLPLDVTLGMPFTFSVSHSSGISDYIVRSQITPDSNLRLQPTMAIDGKFVDSIEKSEVVGNAFTIKAEVGGALPFGSLDTSKFESMRILQLGLGGSRTGVSPGRIYFQAGTWFRTFGSSFRVITGPTVEWSWETPRRTQLKVPAGYVDVNRSREDIAISYYSDGSYPVLPSGERDFSAGTPVATYHIKEMKNLETTFGITPPVGLGIPVPDTVYNGHLLEITRTIGGVTTLLEHRTARLTRVTGPTPALNEDIHPGSPRIWFEKLVAVSWMWAWRELSAPRQGLIELVAHTETQKHEHYPSHAITSYPQPIWLEITRRDGADGEAPVASYEKQSYGIGDWQMMSSYGSEHGLAGVDRHSGPSRGVVTGGFGGLAIKPTVKRNGKGGSTITIYNSHGSFLNQPGNLDGEPTVAVGEPKKIRQSFLDYSSSDDQHDLITTLSYEAELVDGRPAPKSSVTRQGSGGPVIGRTDFSYAEGSFNGVPGVTTTSLRHISGTSAALQTVTRNYSRRLADLDLRGKPISIENPDGSKTSYGYQRGTLSGASWSGSSGGADLRVVELNGSKASSNVTAFDGVTVDPLAMEFARSSAVERIFDAEGQLRREQVSIYTSSGFIPLPAIYHAYNPFGLVVMRADQPIAVTGGVPSTSGRVRYEALYSGFRKVQESDEQGVSLDYTYDNYGRVHTMSRAAASDPDSGNTIPATTTTYTYDGAGRLATEVVSASGSSETFASSYTYDTGNRPKARTLPGGFTTSIVYDSATSTTTTFPGGGKKTDEIYKDGRPKSRTGSAVPDSTTSYVFDSATGNLKTTQTTAGQWAVTESDWAGRTVSVSTPAYGGAARVMKHTYTGALLTKQETRVGGAAIALPRVFEYDAYARLVREGVDGNGNGALDAAHDYDIKEYEFAFQTDVPNHTSSDWFRYDGVKIWPYAGVNASESVYASQTYTQVSGLGTTTLGRAISRDLDQNETMTTITVERANKKVVTSTTATGTVVTLQQVTLNGLPIKSVNAQGHVTLQTYDPLGRLLAMTDPRTGTTSYEYYPNTSLPETVTAPDNRSTGYGYDDAGRMSVLVDAENKTAHFNYDLAGNLTHQWGATVNPVKYLYNELGQKTQMHTYRDGSWTGNTLPSGFASAGDVTTWNYETTTGLLLSKRDAENAETSFQYTELGQVKKRTDARGWITDYKYTDPRKLLTNVEYTGSAAEATTDVAYIYDRVGRLHTVTDAAGVRTFGYYDSSATPGTLDASGRLKSETLPAAYGGHTLTQRYQFGLASRVNGSSTGFDLNAGAFATYEYDDMLRPNSVTYGDGTPFVYSYVENSNLINTVTQGSGYQRVYDHYPDSNRLEELKHFWGATLTTEARLTYDGLGRRQMEKTQGASWMAAVGRASEAGVDADYIYSDRSEVISSGKYALNADWTVGALRAGSPREFVYDAIGNRTADQAGSYIPNSLNQYDAAPGVGSLTYDLNGNLTGDGMRSYAYDAENRLIQITHGSSVWTYKYDYLGRRIEKSGTGIATTKFLYDGWSVIAELDANGTVTRKFVWGLDVSGSLQGAGGVGGLLAIDDIATGVQYLPVYDASHNVIGMRHGATGAFAAAYEYDPFGNLQTAQGSYAGSNPFRFSTKYTDAESGFVYYGYRYYSSQLGRFLNRDPIEETGGLNLYGFCGNDGVNRYDYLGMNAVWDWLTTETDPNMPVSTDHEDVFSRIFRTGGVGRKGADGDTYWEDNPFTSTIYGNSPDKSLAAERYAESQRNRGDYYITDIPWEGDKPGSRVIRTNNPKLLAEFWVRASTTKTESEIYIVTNGNPVKATPKEVVALAKSQGGTIDVFLNGQSNDLKKAIRNGGKQLGVSSFVLFHNPTHGGLRDTLESAGGKLTGTSQVGREFGNFLLATSGVIVNLVVHSQGGITANIGMNQVLSQGALPGLSIHYNGAAVNEMASRSLVSSVGATFNGFSTNRGDPVPLLLGGNARNLLQVLHGIGMLPSTITGIGSPHSNYAPLSRP